MTYPEFWGRYLAAHGDRRSRALHFIGTGGALVLLALAGAMRDWRWLIPAPVFGYSFAWFGHFGFFAPMAAVGFAATMQQWRRLWLLYILVS